MAEEVKQKAKRGRPLIFKSSQELSGKIDNFFEEYEAKGKALTMIALANYLGCDKSTLLDYANKSDEFSFAIKKAKDRCEEYVVERLFNKFSPGAIFEAKNNYGYTDKQEITTPPGQPFETVSVNLDGANVDDLKALIANTEQILGKVKGEGTE